MYGGQSNDCRGRYQNYWKSTSQTSSPNYEKISSRREKNISYRIRFISYKSSSPPTNLYDNAPSSEAYGVALAHKPKEGSNHILSCRGGGCLSKMDLAIFITASYSALRSMGRNN